MSPRGSVDSFEQLQAGVNNQKVFDELQHELNETQEKPTEIKYTSGDGEEREFDYKREKSGEGVNLTVKESMFGDRLHIPHIKGKEDKTRLAEVHGNASEAATELPPEKRAPAMHELAGNVLEAQSRVNATEWDEASDEDRHAKIMEQLAALHTAVSKVDEEVDGLDREMDRVADKVEGVSEAVEEKGESPEKKKGVLVGLGEFIAKNPKVALGIIATVVAIAAGRIKSVGEAIEYGMKNIGYEMPALKNDNEKTPVITKKESKSRRPGFGVKPDSADSIGR